MAISDSSDSMLIDGQETGHAPASPTLEAAIEYSTAAMEYNYAHFAVGGVHRRNLGGPKVGDVAPEIRVTTDLDDGVHVALSAFRGRFVVLETGSASCPKFEQHITAMNALAYRFPDVLFLVLYTREAHPGQYLGPHRWLSDKRAAAKVLRQSDREGRRILIDSLDGEAHLAYGGMPNSVHVIDPDGVVVFRSTWNDPPVLEKALSQASAGRDPGKVRPRFHPSSPTVAWRVLARSGSQAWQDMIVGFPKQCAGRAKHIISQHRRHWLPLR